MKHLIIEANAELELDESVRFYEQRLAGLGLDFEAELREGLQKIVRAPERFPSGNHGTRHYVMRRFPFIIH